MLFVCSAMLCHLYVVALSFASPEINFPGANVQTAITECSTGSPTTTATDDIYPLSNPPSPHPPPFANAAAQPRVGNDTQHLLRNSGMRLPKCQGSGPRNVNLDMGLTLFGPSLFGTRLPTMSHVINQHT